MTENISQESNTPSPDSAIDKHLEVVDSPDGSAPQVRFTLVGTKETVMEVLFSLVGPAAGRRGRKPGKKNLSPDAVRDIRRRAAAGEDREVLAHEFALCPQSIDNIAAKRTWAGVSDE